MGFKIKVREKIVADGIDDPNFSMERRGKYLTAEEFNQMTNNPDVLVVDMRNHYEYEVGHFEDAVEIPSETFREQLPMAVEMLQEQKDKNIIMYCTGGIRCEKPVHGCYIMALKMSIIWKVELLNTPMMLSKKAWLINFAVKFCF